MQNTNHLLMIRPVNFAFNAETAVNNSFQTASTDGFVQTNALQEFDTFVDKLRENGIDVTVVQDSPEPHTPDSIFPNNWISFHKGGTICLYPMFAQNRRLERKQSVLDAIQQKFRVNQTIDFTKFEAGGIFLEGTGSMVLDRENYIAYACISPRTNPTLFNDWCKTMQYKPVAFDALDENDLPIYHTNVMMCVADKYVVICIESIAQPEVYANLVKPTIEASGKTIIAISHQQMNQFAGNMLQVKNQNGQQFLIMSTQAHNSLTEEQIGLIEAFNPIIHSRIATIETNGGGSARCMMAEVFLNIL